MSATARVFQAPEKRFQVARILVCAVFLLLPFVISLNGLDKFRTPKDIAASVAITVLAIVCLANPDFRMKLGGFEATLLAASAFVLLHSLFWGVVEAAVTVCLFSVWILLLSRLMSWEFQKRVWLLAGLSLSVTSLINVLQSLGKFPWMLRESGKGVAERFTAAGFLGEVGSGALLFALLVLVSLYFLLLEEKTPVRALWLLICLCNLTGLIFTRTLTASLALGASLVLWLVFHHWWVFRRHPESRRRLAVFWMVVVLGLAGSAALASKFELLARVTSKTRAIIRGDWEVASAGRYSVFLITWNMIQDRPLAGYGLGSFPPSFYQQRVGTDYGRKVVMMPQAGAFQQAHNEYLQIWAELGLPGLLLLLGLMAHVFWSASRAALREPDPRQSYWLGILALSLFVFGVASLTIFPFHITATAIFLTFIVGSLRHLELYGFEDQSGEASAATGRARGLLTVMALVLAVPVVYGQYRKWQTNNTLGVAAFLLEQASGSNYTARQRRTVSTRVMAMLDRAEEGYPGFPELYNLRGSAAMFLGRYRLAAASYEKMVTQMPSPETMTNLAAALIAQNDCDQARIYLDSALEYRITYRKAREARRHCDEQAN